MVPLPELSLGWEQNNCFARRRVQNDLFSEDFEGKELADLDAAREYATAGARSIAAETVLEGRLERQHYVEILDAGRSPITRIRFGDVIDVRG